MHTTKEDTNKKIVIGRIIDYIVFALFLFLMTYFFGRLVYAQTLYAGKEGGYTSDIYAYMQEMQGIDSGYSFPYPLFFGLGKLLNLFMPIEYAITIAEMALNVLAIVITKVYLEKVLEKSYSNESWYHHILITLFLYFGFVISMWWLPRFGKIHLPLKDQVFYGTYSGNPWHNATYIATRPFAIGAFFALADLIEKEDSEFNWKKGIIFGVFLLLTTLAKPSFTLVCGSTIAVICIIRLIKTRFKYIKNTSCLFICCIPTFIALAFQYLGVFGEANPNDEHGIGLDFFRVWRDANPHVIAAIFYANVFSLVSLIFLIKQNRKLFLYRFAILLFVVSVAEAGLLCEKGFRYPHFNFSWGYMHGIFFFALATIVVLLKNIFEKTIKPVFAIICIIALLSQVIAGVLYFRGLYCGLDYNTLLPYNWL